MWWIPSIAATVVAALISRRAALLVASLGAVVLALTAREESPATITVAALSYLTSVLAVAYLRGRLDRALVKQLEAQEIARGTRVAAVRQISSGLVHELRNSLGVIRNAVSLLRRQLAKVDVRGDLLEMIDEEVRSADSALTRLSESIRARDPEMTHVEAAAFLHEAVDRLDKRDGVICSVAVAPDVHTLWCDPAQLAQALDALLRNAVEASPERGEVVLAARREGDQNIIEVCDSGHGVDPRVAEEIFEPLYTTKRGRCGLGLPRARQVALRHGGRLEVIGAGGPGAKFRFTLPHRASPATILQGAAGQFQEGQSVLRSSESGMP